MYHYVRELAETRYPAIRGLDVSLFREQLAFMQRFYQFITVADMIEAIRHDHALPRNAVLLTFDDGYSDHYQNVFPILDAAGIQGCFFPPVCAVRDARVLDVNKIHFVLASIKDLDQLLQAVYAELARLRSEGHEIAPTEDLYQQLALPHDFDPPQIIFIKRLLQRELPQNMRTEIVDALFKRYVTDNEKAFARELYVNEEQLRMMVRRGMIIGSHGSEHRWMNTLSPEEQNLEIEESLSFLGSIGVPRSAWLMCYPYGAHNESLRNTCRDLDCSLAFTTKVGIAEISQANALTLPRLDTNHLPKYSAAPPNSWVQRVIA